MSIAAFSRTPRLLQPQAIALLMLRPRTFHSTRPHLEQSIPTQQRQPPSPAATAKAPSPHGNFYRTHGRALFKTLTLAFFSFQCFYWTWTTLETEELKDEKRREIKSLEGEVRLLEEGKNSHQPEKHVKS